MADEAISEAKRPITIPSTEGFISPSITAKFIATTDDALAAAGESYACTVALRVEVVEVKVYSDANESMEGDEGPLIPQRDPVVVAAEV